MIQKIGTFETKSGELRVTDPCYDRGTWCSGVVKNCEVGKWSAFLIHRIEGEWGERVAEQIAVFDDITVEQVQKLLDEGDWKDTRIDVGVDSGQAGIFDETQYPEEKGEYGDLDSFYGKCCELTLNEPSGGVLDFGVVSSSGFGDGSYICLTLTKNKVFALKIIFIDEIEHNLEDED